MCKSQLSPRLFFCDQKGWPTKTSKFISVWKTYAEWLNKYLLTIREAPQYSKLPTNQLEYPIGSTYSKIIIQITLDDCDGSHYHLSLWFNHLWRFIFGRKTVLKIVRLLHSSTKTVAAPHIPYGFLHFKLIRWFPSNKAKISVVFKFKNIDDVN